MAVDKNKVIAEATKFAQRGQWDRAIKSYERILSEDAKDVRVLLKVGELHQKRGDDAAAAGVFNRVAEAYTEQGFFLKAIAVYKQMMKLAPDDLRVNERLASLYQQLGIMSDAMAQLQLVAAAAEKAADQNKLLDVLQRMTEIEPDNVGSAVKLGEVHARAGRSEKALDEFRRAADLLKRNNRAEEYVRVAERIAYLAPDDVQLTRELANIYLAKGDTKRALAKLQLSFKADPKDLETLHLLAQAFQALGQGSKTISVFKELAHVYGEKGRADEARGTWQRVLELAPDDPEALQALRPAVAQADEPPPAPARPAPGEPPVKPARAPPPGMPPGARAAAIAPPPPAPPPGPPAPAARPLPPEAIPKLLTETDVYVKYGLHQKAVEHLRKVFDIDPDHLDAREKARDVRLAGGDQAGAVEEGLRLARLALARGQADRARAAVAWLQERAPGTGALAELAAQVGVVAEPEELLVEPEALLPEPEAELVVEPQAEEPDDLALAGAEAGAEEVIEDDDVALVAADGEADGPVLEDEPLGAPLPPEAAPLPPLSAAAVAELAPRMAFPPPPPAELTPRLPIAPPPPPVARPLTPTPPPMVRPLTPTPPPMVRPLTPTPPPTARPLTPTPPPAVRPLTPTPPPAEAPRLAVAPPPAAPATEAPRLAIPPPGRAFPPPAAPPPVAAAQEPEEEELDLSDELEDVEFFMQQGLFDDAREALGNLSAFYPDHVAVKAKVADLERRQASARRPTPVPHRPEAAAAPLPAPVAGPITGSFDLAKELDAELLSEPLPPAEEFQYSVEEVFSQFKKGVAQTVKAEDTDTHYDLGIAYKEMGLTDDALAEFETALRGAPPRKQIDCLSMIGLCRMARGDAAGAVQAFRRALDAGELRPDSARALQYEVGAAYQALGDVDSALWYLHQVVKADASFRDAQSRVRQLGGGPGRAPPPASAAPPPLDPRGGAKKNIGYV